MTLLENLLTLHRVDSQVRALRTRLDAAKAYLDAQDRQLAVLERQRIDLESQLKQLHAVIHGLELDQAQAQERIDKLRGELNASTNDKQYKAILNELKVLEVQKDDVVRRELEELQRVEDVKKRAELHAATVVERGKVREVARSKFEECTRDVGDRLAELEAEREQAARLIPERERKVFDRVADETAGEAMAEVTIVDLRHREFACGACNIELPFDVYSRLASSSDILLQCKACTRILFLLEANKPGEKEKEKARRPAKDVKAAD